MSSIYIVDACRTAIGRANKGLKHFSAASLAAEVLKGLNGRHDFSQKKISEVIFGNVVSAGTGQNLAREAVHLAGLPLSIPAYVVNNVCGSGLQAVLLGIKDLVAENSSWMVAGAAESATHNPLMMEREGDPPVESLFQDGLKCPIAQRPMGQLCEALAQRENIFREKQDLYSLESHQKACRAREQGSFREEIIVVPREGQEPFSEDECPRIKTSLEKLQKLPSVFAEKGMLTAGNSSAAADGACALLLASEEAVKNEGVTPLARICGYATVGVNPSAVFSEGIKAVQECLQTSQLSLEEIDLFEITEAFAAQAIYAQEALKISKDKVNIYGGDVALGHPLGIAGLRALVTLGYALKKNKKKKGLVFTSFGAGGAIAIAVECAFA